MVIPCRQCIQPWEFLPLTLCKLCTQIYITGTLIVIRLTFTELMELHYTTSIIIHKLLYVQEGFLFFKVFCFQ